MASLQTHPLTRAQVTVQQRGAQFPVVVLPGVSHFQFAGEGSVPLLVKARDLQPEVSQVRNCAIVIKESTRIV